MRLSENLRRAAEAAARFLVDNRVTSLPVSPQRLLHACPDTRVYTVDLAADALGIPAVQLQNLFRGADAVTFRRREQYIVVFRADGNPARLRFTLAHELGHRLLHPGEASTSDEAEADCFASHLLCPAPLLDRLRVTRSADMIDLVAQRCYVTRSCAAAALKRPPVTLPSHLAGELSALCTAMLTDVHVPKAE